MLIYLRNRPYTGIILPHIIDKLIAPLCLLLRYWSHQSPAILIMVVPISLRPKHDQVEFCSLEYNPVASTVLLVLAYMERGYIVTRLRIAVLHIKKELPVSECMDKGYIDMCLWLVILTVTHQPPLFRHRDPYDPLLSVDRRTRTRTNYIAIAVPPGDTDSYCRFSNLVTAVYSQLVSSYIYFSREIKILKLIKVLL